jgi:hypothetical protein
VVLADADEPGAVGRDVAVGVAVAAGSRGLRGQQGDLTVDDPPQPLVGPVDGEHDAVVHPPRAAAVLVHGGAGVGARGQQVVHRAVGGATDQLDAAPVCGAALPPHHGVAVGDHPVEADGSGHDEVRGHRGHGVHASPQTLS